MKSVSVSKHFEGDAREMAERCHRLDSRKAWPGAVLMSGAGATLYYQVSMRLRAAAMTDIDIEERQGPIEQRADGSFAFATTQKVTWPNGIAHAETEYVFTPGTPSTVLFTYRYEPPPAKLVKPKAAPAFHEGMQKVVDLYISKLAAPVSA